MLQQVITIKLQNLISLLSYDDELINTNTLKKAMTSTLQRLLQIQLAITSKLQGLSCTSIRNHEKI